MVDPKQISLVSKSDRQKKQNKTKQTKTKKKKKTTTYLSPSIFNFHQALCHPPPFVSLNAHTTTNHKTALTSLPTPRDPVHSNILKS